SCRRSAGSAWGRSCPGSAASAGARFRSDWRRRSYLVPHTLVDLTAVHADDRLLPIGQHGLADAGGLVALVADEHYVGVVERRLEVDDAALADRRRALLLTGARVTLQDVDALDDGLADLALLHLAAWRRHRHGGRDDVADGGVLAVMAAHHPDQQDLTRTRVVRYLQPRLLLHHGDRYFAFSTMATTRQRLSCES